jgi:spermidine/putrescine transport system permease protein
MPAEPPRASRGERLLAGHFALVLAFLYLPIAVLIVLSFNESGLPTAWGGFSARWYESAVQNEAIISSLGNTLIVAGVTTLISTVIGTLLAVGLERSVQSRVLEGAVFVPMVIPEIVLAIALLSFYNLVFVGWAGLQLGLWSIILAHSVFNIVAAIVRTRLRHFDFSTVEASLDLGASEVRTFRKVMLPALLPGVIAGALVAFTLSFDEFVIAYFNAGTTVTFPIQIYSMIRFGVTPEINAIATFVVVLSFTLLLVSQRLRGREVLA